MRDNEATRHRNGLHEHPEHFFSSLQIQFLAGPVSLAAGAGLSRTHSPLEETSNDRLMD
jgi:hypothetical protein